MTLLRFDPFRELDRWAAWPTLERRASMPLDALRRDDELIVRLDLPGVDPDSIDVTVENGSLTVAAERPSTRREGDEVVIAERPHGRCVRRLLLGDGLDTEAVRADYDRGVLTVVIPTAEAVRPRKIQVTAGKTGPAIDAAVVKAHGDGADQPTESHAA